jgi:hypothetical protein
VVSSKKLAWDHYIELQHQEGIWTKIIQGINKVRGPIMHWFDRGRPDVNAEEDCQLMMLETPIKTKRRAQTIKSM